MVGRHVNQNLGIRQGQLGVASQNHENQPSGQHKERPSSILKKRLTKLGHDGATHSVDLAPDYIRISWSRMSRKLALASLPRRAGSTRLYRTTD